MIDTQKIKKLDTADVYSSIKQLPHQIEQAMKDVERIAYPEKYRDAENIAISGMGGSIYNYYVISSLFTRELHKPIIAVNGYELPAYMKAKTLFVGSSYSGSTEETIASTTDAIKQNLLVTALTTGGKLGELMKFHDLPFYQFTPHFNPCGQPRVGVGYMIFGAIFILSHLGLLHLDIAAVHSAITTLKNNDARIQEKAYKLKNQMKDTIIIFVGSEHVSGVVHAARNQINETAKAFAQYHLIPELNHHLMEGLTYPKDKKLTFVFYNSHLYHGRNRKRYDVTKKVLDKQGVPYIDVSLEGKNKLEEFLLYLQLSSYLSFFLGIDYGVDPSQIQWVDYFKKELAK
ncbi:MAG TPA: SIS domain-containing protein [Patescibacteria group bacterium]|nr:SIS domain-containing protein [Patescibacteria group bacterium]